MPVTTTPLTFLLVVAVLAGACRRETPSGGEQATAARDSAPDQAAGAAIEHLRVTLTPEGMRTAGIEVVPVASEAGALAHGGLDVPGQVEFDPHRVALASPRAAGRLERLLAVEGDRVAAGQVVAEVASPEFLSAQADFVQASMRARLLAPSADSAGAAALAAASRRRLARLGITDGELARLADGGEPRELLPVTSPLAGTVMRTHILAGAAVEAGTPVFDVADLAVMDVVAQVPERSLPLLQLGRRASISVVAFPGLHMDGRVERLRGGLDPETRTAQAVVHVLNPGGRLRPGMYATVRLDVPEAAATPEDTREPVLLIPSEAVVNDGESRVVFVEVGERTYERREVRVEPHTSGALGADPAPQLRVREGLRAGERVVAHGAFVLKSELGKAAFGEEE
jgi:RND family efflux transporter MFP subunit